MGTARARLRGTPLPLLVAFSRSAFPLAAHFLFQAPRPEPLYLHRTLHDFHTIWEMGCYEDARANRPPHGIFDKELSYWRFFLGPVLTLPFVKLPWLLRSRSTTLLHLHHDS